MSAEHIPTAAALTAHVRTAVDGSVRWIERGLRVGPGDVDGWDQAGFFGRMMLMRGLERAELLGWVLERDARAERQPERREALRSGVAYWSEARSELHDAIGLLRTAADLPPATARREVEAARERLLRGGEWLIEIAEGLGRTQERSRPTERWRTVDSGLTVELDAS